MAQTLRKANKTRKRVRNFAIATAILGIAAIPFTGGSSAGATTVVVKGLAASTTAGATVSVSAAEIAIILRGGIALAAVVKGFKTKFNSDGSVEVTPSYKN